MNRCEELQEQITALADRELSGQERQEAREHLSRCPECRLLYEEMASTRNLLKNSYHYEEPPASLWQKASARIDAMNWQPARPVRRFAWRFAPALALLLVALAAMAGYHAWDEGRPKPIDLADLARHHNTYPVTASMPVAPGCDANCQHVAMRLSMQTDQPIRALPLTEQENLLGGRVCSPHHRPYVQMVFRHNGQIYSVFEIPSERVTPLPTGDPCFTQDGICQLSGGSVSAAAWEKGDLTFVLVSDSPAQILLPMARRLRDAI
ncbi:MAG: zf-HC2 domain-containing protein [Armatimonadetes bacterium]|nr:zf-HC2 domain-containing protein [Armatimonadota bacterium]